MPDLFGMVTVFSSVPIFVFGRIFTSNRTTTEMSRKCTPVFVKALLADLGAVVRVEAMASAKREVY